jgi:dTDP-4-dehydrorhamnose 3,5-epimerase
METINIEGVILTQLKQIYHSKGNVFHVMKRSDLGFKGFGEVYFSTVKYKNIKAWKKHTKMTLNLTVPIGKVKFVLFDDRENSVSRGKFFETELSINNYQRLTIPPNIWIGFEGVARSLNLLLNLANMEHDPDEIIRLDLDKIDYNWEK